MWIIPAIDILGGKCVRLRGGDYNAVSVYEDEPAAAAERFLRGGARRLHVVDLDAAKVGAPVNTAAVAAVLAVAAANGAEVEVGGGLRDRAAVAAVLEAGASYAILGTAAVRAVALRDSLIADYPGRIIVGADARDNTLAVNGWLEDSRERMDDFLAGLRQQPPAALIHTDICRDGMLVGVNVAAVSAIADAAPCPVIASGGVGGMADLHALAAAGNVAGVIIGQALYTGAIQLEEALAL